MTVDLTATPDTSSVFAGWSGACVGLGVCTVRMDLDRAVTARFAPPAEFLGAWSYGGSGEDFGHATAVDASGNVYVAGRFEATVNLGGGLLTSAGLSDVFLAKYSGSDGRHLWSERFGGTGQDFPLAIAVEPSGDVYFTGIFSGTVNFGGGPLTAVGNGDIFFAKYAAADGRHIWSRRFGSSAPPGLFGPADATYSLVVDPRGDIVMAGGGSAGADFGAGPLAAGGIIVAKYAGSDGSSRWVAHFSGASSGGTGVSADVDDLGNVVATGLFGGTIDFGGGGLSSAGTGTFDAFVVKLSGSNGRHLWSRRYGGPGWDAGISAVLDSMGDVVFSGYFSGSVSVGGTVLAGDTVLGKYSGVDGAHVWSEAFRFMNTMTVPDLGGMPQAPRLVVDLAGGVTLATRFEGPVDVGGGVLTSAGSGDVLVAKFSGSDGSHFWSERFGGAGDDFGLGIAADLSGRLAVVGGFSGTVDFGAGPRTSAGGTDIFVLSIGP